MLAPLPALLLDNAPYLVAGAAAVASALIWACTQRPTALLMLDDGTVMDPRGGPGIKNLLARGMARIARGKELRKVRGSTPEALEDFHHPEDHDFFNESHYYNGCDAQNDDRIITRISRRGRGAKISYVFLLLDTTEHGPLSLEEDRVPVTSSAGGPGQGDHPEAVGLSYICEEPMRRWRLHYEGPMRRGAYVPPATWREQSAGGEQQGRRGRQLNDEEEDEADGFETVQVVIDLVYERDTPVFWYMRDDCPETLAKNLSQEPWGFDFVKVRRA